MTARKDGRRVLLLADDEADLTAELTQRGPSLGWDLRVIPTDSLISDPTAKALEGLAASAINDLGGLDAAIVVPPRSPWSDFVDETRDSVSQGLLAGFLAPFMFLQAAARQMLEAHSGGRLIAVCDCTALRGLNRAALHSATQGGLLALLRSLAQELANRGITANCVLEGWSEATPGRGPASPEQNKLMRYIPMKRFGTAHDLVGVLQYLVSEDSAFLTGQAIAVDGGLLKHL